jgi:HAD superfamily hydrolase (TIGR01509 family)
VCTSLNSRIELPVALSVVTIHQPAAVLWDMDGTLVDTEPYWMAAEIALVESHGGSWTHDDAIQLVGSGLWHSARVLQSRGVKLSEDEIISALTDRVLEQVAERVPWRAGSRELLAELRQRGIPTALVTMSIRRMAQIVADAVGFPAFGAIVAGDDVTNSKPHPEPYERAAELLGVSPHECIAIEDSEPGIASAVAAGAVVIGVPLHIPIGESDQYALWQGVDGKTVDDLVAHFQDWRELRERHAQ